MENELSQTIEKLHLELSQNPHIDENTLRSMRSLLNEIRSTIDASDNAKQTKSPEAQSISTHLQSLIADFEARHPQLTATLSQIADRLTDMGI